jgi:hypothetical protein
LLYVAANLTTAMTPALILTIVYFSALILISVIAGKGADTNTFFTANRQSPRYVATEHRVLIKILMPLYSTPNFVSIHTPPECDSASSAISPVTSLLSQGSVHFQVLSHCLQPKENQTSLFSTHY